MTMHVGDVVNIIKHDEGYWKGKITSVTDRYSDEIIFTSPIAMVRGDDGVGCAAVREKDLCRKDSEWTQVRI